MNNLAKALVTAALIVMAGGFTIVTPAGAATSSPTMLYGMEANSIDAQTAAGVKPDFATFWVGPWTLKHGWAGPDAQLAKMRDQGITPVIHFYYWGDDISPTCVENGCYSDLHGTWKDKAGWDRLANELVQHLNTQMKGEKVYILMETEFNKGGIQNYEPFDGYLAEKSKQIKDGYPPAETVLAFGNWGHDAWKNFDRAAEASTMTGLQSMRGSTRDSYSWYHQAYEATLSGSQRLQTLFGKPILIHDIALSSYPEPDYIDDQASELKEFFDGQDALQQAGVTGMIYRSWYNNANFDLKNYYGYAERHWGLTWSQTSDLKPSGKVWVDGVKAERAGAGASPPAPTSPTGPYEATFSPKSMTNEWWIEVAVSASSTPSKVEVQLNDGTWKALPKQSWGAYAASYHAPSGTKVEFRAVASDGRIAESGVYTWGKQSAPTTTQPAPEPTPTAYEAKFTPKGMSNAWWIEVAVSASSTPSKVEVQLNDGAWKALPKQSWGAYAASYHAPAGTKVEFRAIASDGRIATSQAYTWGGSTTSTTSSYTASFTPKTQSNEYWFEVAVSASPNPKSVQACKKNNECVTLSATSWGTWAGKPNGATFEDVRFVATSPDGSKAYSKYYRWG